MTTPQRRSIPPLGWLGCAVVAAIPAALGTQEPDHGRCERVARRRAAFRVAGLRSIGSDACPGAYIAASMSTEIGPTRWISLCSGPHLFAVEADRRRSWRYVVWRIAEMSIGLI